MWSNTLKYNFYVEGENFQNFEDILIFWFKKILVVRFLFLNIDLIKSSFKIVILNFLYWKYYFKMWIRILNSLITKQDIKWESKMNDDKWKEYSRIYFEQISNKKKYLQSLISPSQTINTNNGYKIIECDRYWKPLLVSLFVENKICNPCDKHIRWLKRYR